MQYTRNFSIDQYVKFWNAAIIDGLALGIRIYFLWFGVVKLGFWRVKHTSWTKGVSGIWKNLFVKQQDMKGHDGRQVIFWVGSDNIMGRVKIVFIWRKLSWMTHLCLAIYKSEDLYTATDEKNDVKWNEPKKILWAKKIERIRILITI